MAGARSDRVSQSERHELFPKIDRARYVPVKLDRKGKVVVCGQLRRHQGELYVLCHSAARASKDRAIRQRFEQRLEQDADKLKVRVAAGRLKKPEKINRALGRLSGRYPRVARYYTLQLHTDEKGQAEVTWARKDAAQQLAEELDGTYLLRTDRTDLAATEVWQLYVLLARIERSFRYLKSTLGIRPVFHQRTERVDAHIFISLLAYHLVHTIERRLQDNGDYRSWPTIRDLLATHQMVTIVHHCTDGTVLRLRRPSQPELEHRNIYRTLRLGVCRIQAASNPYAENRSRLLRQERDIRVVGQFELRGLARRWKRSSCGSAQYSGTVSTRSPITSRTNASIEVCSRCSTSSASCSLDRVAVTTGRANGPMGPMSVVDMPVSVTI